MLEIRSLTAEEENARQEALQLAARLTGRSLPLAAHEVQAVYDVMLADDTDWEEGVIALGVSFGELIVEKAGYQWVRVIDEWGSENSLSPIGWDACCHPISMIQKRIERREAVQLSDLVDDTIHTIEKRITDGLVGTRKIGS